jgi:NADH/NAD ratio-sensing transcriptional regulator Rex
MSSVKKVVLAYSGGLDTSIIIPWLKEKYGGTEVIAFCGDVGQGDDYEAVRAKALKTGASKCVVRDLREEFVRDYCYKALAAGAVYEDRYLLGTALARYRGFGEQGFRLVGMFDSSATVIGARFGSGDDDRVRGIHELDEFCRKERVDIAMITVPAGEAENTVQRLGAAGVKAILNFAPIKVHTPEGVLVRQVDLSSELMSLSFYLDKEQE